MRERGDEAREHLVAVLERLADHDDVVAVAAHEHADGPVDAGHAPLAAHGLDGPARAAVRLDQPPVGALDLREAVLRVADAPASAPDAATAAARASSVSSTPSSRSARTQA